MPNSERNCEKAEKYQIKGTATLAETRVFTETVDESQPKSRSYFISEQSKVHFSVRAIDKYGRPGSFSTPTYS